MEEILEMYEDKKLREEELKTVAGGILAGAICYFKPDGEVKYENGKFVNKCSALCFANRTEGWDYQAQCHCHGTHRCNDRMHDCDAKGNTDGFHGK